MLSKKELYQLNLKDLLSELDKSRKELIKYRLGVRTNHLKENHLIKNFKRYIAQILTLMKQLSSTNNTPSAPSA